MQCIEGAKAKLLVPTEGVSSTEVTECQTHTVCKERSNWRRSTENGKPKDNPLLDHVSHANELTGSS